MKSLLILLAGAAAAASVVARADPATLTPIIPSTRAPVPASSPAAGAPGATPSPGAPAASSVPLPGLPSGPSLENTLPLMPEPAPSPGPGRGRHGKKGGAFGPNGVPMASPTRTFDVERDIRLQIRLRQAWTRAGNESAIQADWVAAHRTRNDPDRRAALTTYYNHLYDRMAQIDPSVAAQAALLKEGAIYRMRYGRLGDEDVPQEDPFAAPRPPAEGQNPPLPDEIPP